MKLSVNSLKFPHNVAIAPDASWLKLIAADLCPSSPEKASIQGALSLTSDTAGFIKVIGHVSAEAVLPCDRCGKDVCLPLKTEITATFRPEYQENAPREMSLSAEDLDVYFIESGTVDLEVLVNDSLQCAIPSHIQCDHSAGRTCDAGDDSLVYSDSKDFQADSPFAVLKNLKKS